MNNPNGQKKRKIEDENGLMPQAAKKAKSQKQMESQEPKEVLVIDDLDLENQNQTRDKPGTISDKPDTTSDKPGNTSDKPGNA